MIKNSCLYLGEVEHRRLSPKKNFFRYAVAYYFVDLAETRTLFRFPFLFSYNFPGILSFWRKDYLGNPKIDLDTSVREIVKSYTEKEATGPIRLLTNISYFGFCMNPVSFYYCYAGDGKTLQFIVSEITNTPWGEKHRQVFEFDGKEMKVFKFPKDFHVSPFMPMNIDYTWVFHSPDEKLKVYMQNRLTGQPQLMFDSTLDLKRKDLTLGNVLGTFLRLPLVTFKTLLAIYYQAFKLYIKKVPFYTHPSKEKLYDNSTLT
jgi:uncharacterized protein